jgi:hypothetical protein
MRNSRFRITDSIEAGFLAQVVLRQVLRQQVPESRSVHGLRHQQATVLAMVFAYLLSGGRGGHRGVRLFAKD